MKKILIVICTFFLAVVIAVCFRVTVDALMSIGPRTDFNVESLRWSIIGAMGGWVGSIFGAIALIVSLFALWLPQRIKIKVSISCAMMVPPMTDLDKIDAYVITVKNVGMKPITIRNIYLHFGGKKQGDIFIGALNQNSFLQAYTPSFPLRLDQGEYFDYYLPREKLGEAFASYEEKMSIDTPLSVRVDEVTKGTRYYKTKWSLKSFIRK